MGFYTPVKEAEDEDGDEVHTDVTKHRNAVQGEDEDDEVDLPEVVFGEVAEGSHYESSRVSRAEAVEHPVHDEERDAEHEGEAGNEDETAIWKTRVA